MRELKAEKIRELDEAEIEAKIKERNEELFHLRFRNQMRTLTNPVLIRERRRDIARLMTVLAQMQKARMTKGAPAEQKEKKA
jgi:large subunit ribosomal protein L29